MRSSTAAAFWGCNENELLDVWNCARTLEYVRKYLPQKYLHLKNCCPDFGAIVPPVGSSPHIAALPGYLSQVYDNPVADGAWWVDPGRPESSGFFGFHVTSLTGRFDNTLDVDVNSGQSCGAVNTYLSKNRPQILTIEASAYGVGCCSIAYGVRALRRLLSECGCSGAPTGCRGTQLTLHDCGSGVSSMADTICIPPGDSFVVPASDGSPWRMLKNAKLIEMPEVVDTQGKSCGSCGCGEMATIRFTIAVDPGAYLDVTPVMTPWVVVDPMAPCIVACDPNDCTAQEFLLDPECLPPKYVSPGDTAVNCFCAPLIRRETCTEIDLGPRHFLSEIEFEITAGPTALRNLEIRLWNKDGILDYSSGEYNTCNSAAGFTVAYVPANGTLTRTIHGVTIETASAKYDASATIGGKSSAGGDACIRLEGGEYIVCAFSDPDETDAAAALSISAREYEP